MKKITYLAIAALLTISSASFAQVRASLTGGTVLANMYSKENGSSTKLQNKAGITGGVEVDIPAGSNLSFQTGLNFVQKGTRDVSDIMGGQYKFNLSLNQIELPLNLLYNTRHEKGNFFIGAGPSLAYGISGKYSIEYGQMKEGKKLEFGNDPEKVKPFDAGINAVTGYRFSNGISMSVNYNRGLTNLANAEFPDDAEKITTQYFGLRLGYQFGHKK